MFSEYTYRTATVYFLSLLLLSLYSWITIVLHEQQKHNGNPKCFHSSFPVTADVTQLYSLPFPVRSTLIYSTTVSSLMLLFKLQKRQIGHFQTHFNKSQIHFCSSFSSYKIAIKCVNKRYSGPNELFLLKNYILSNCCCQNLWPWLHRRGGGALCLGKKKEKKTACAKMKRQLYRLQKIFS